MTFWQHDKLLIPTSAMTNQSRQRRAAKLAALTDGRGGGDSFTTEEDIKEK